MKTIEYLNKFGIEKIQKEFAIKVSTDERFPCLYVLNYDQINSPKNHQITKECRSLVVKSELNGSSYSLASRAFDRFFNQGENGDDFELSKLELFEKVDGSLVSVFYVKNHGWLYRTKSIIMPTTAVNNSERTWKDLIESALDWPNIKGLDESCTYIFEVVGKENRVVVDHKEDGAYLLAIRDNSTGKYRPVTTSKFNTPKRYSFSSTNECLESLKHLPGLDEGYVGYIDGTPVVKVKSPKYLAAHRLRGNGLTPKNIIEMVVINECDEYFSVFPEDEEHFKNYLAAWRKLEHELVEQHKKHRCIEDNKAFAIVVKDLLFSKVLFKVRHSGGDVLNALHSQSKAYKVKLLENLMMRGY